MTVMGHQSFFETEKSPQTRMNTKKNVPDSKIRHIIWWRRMDSDHRSETQQIYSLPPLATRELLQIYKAKSPFIELPQQISCERKTHTMELVDGLEPPTC